MVSRQETARPLLTPGEVMQLPPDEAVVMVSGQPPIKAKKLRYYEDSNFMQRVLLPPAVGEGGYTDVPKARLNDWSALAVPTVPTTTTITGVDAGNGDDGGPRQQPELSETVTWEPENQSPINDLSLLDDEDDITPLPAKFDPRLQRLARQAALDPDDGIAL